jgi:hypothetical protein
LQAKGEIGSTGATNEIAVGILSGRQLHPGNGQTRPLKPVGESQGCLLAGLFFVLIKDQVNPATGWVGKLAELRERQMSAEGARGVAKAGLPQHREIEQTFDQNHGGKLPDRLPSEQAASRAGEESMGEGGADTAAVEVDDASLPAAGEDDALVEGIVALRVNKADTPQQLHGVALGHEMTPQVCTGGIADAQLLDESGIVHSALFDIASRFRAMLQLLLIESGCLLQHISRLGGRGILLFEVSEALTEGEMLG